MAARAASLACRRRRPSTRWHSAATAHLPGHPQASLRPVGTVFGGSAWRGPVRSRAFSRSTFRRARSRPTARLSAGARGTARTPRPAKSSSRLGTRRIARSPLTARSRAGAGRPSPRSRPRCGTSQWEATAERAGCSPTSRSSAGARWPVTLPPSARGRTLRVKVGRAAPRPSAASFRAGGRHRRPSLRYKPSRPQRRSQSEPT